ncbi:hypothetical protein QTP88_026032 [Uroleucon formosanum]
MEGRRNNLHISTDSTSPYASLVLLVSMETGEKRLRVDFQRLNQQTVDQPYTIPEIYELHSHLAEGKLFPTLDLSNGFLQIPLTDEAKEKTVFVSGETTAKFEGMPFGLKGSPGMFQKAMNLMFKELKDWTDLANFGLDLLVEFSINCLLAGFETTRLNYKIVIRADKTPAGQHARRFNAPTIDEVAIVVVGENLESRDIVLHRRNDRSQRIKETHRSYDALQYPIIFWQGEDGYDFSIKMINPITGSETNKKVSSMNYYSYLLMIRENENNHILKCLRLYHKYVIDMYVKIETERLIFIRLNQTKLRSEGYIHLRDAINTDGNAQNVGRMTILPATYIGSPRNMHEYAQDAMSYVRYYGTANLFITFTCNPHWIEIKQELFPGQSHIDRHDITARVFRQKLKSLMDFIVKHYKRGLPHAHILIWLIEKIRPNEIDAVISAEIPNVQVDPGLHEVVIKNMIHGPCGTLNQNSPCMMDGKCSKRYPQTLISETITGNDADNGRSTIVKLNQQDIEIDNRWIVPYSPILSKTFKAHISVESCHLVKSIKYICKYVSKGVIWLSNEAVWWIFSFPIRERYPSVVHLAVGLENGQRVYFIAQNTVQRAAQPPSTTLTSFFETCQNDDFAQTLLYSEMPKYYTWNQSSRRFIRRK